MEFIALPLIFSMPKEILNRFKVTIKKTLGKKGEYGKIYELTSLAKCNLLNIIHVLCITQIIFATRNIFNIILLISLKPARSALKTSDSLEECSVTLTKNLYCCGYTTKTLHAYRTATYIIYKHFVLRKVQFSIRKGYTLANMLLYEIHFYIVIIRSIF